MNEASLDTIAKTHELVAISGAYLSIKKIAKGVKNIRIPVDK